MNASSESGLWAMEISRRAPGLAGSAFWYVNGKKSFQGKNCNDCKMRLRVVAVQALRADGQCRSSGNFERVACQEGKHGKSQDRLRRGMCEDSQPKSADRENREVAGGGADECSRESAPGTTEQERDQGRGQRIGKQVAAGGSEKMGQAAGRERAGGEDRQGQNG